MLFGFLSLHLGPCCPEHHNPASGQVTTVVFQLVEPLPDHEDGCDPAHDRHHSHSAGDAVCRAFRATTDRASLAPPALAVLPAGQVTPIRHLRPSADPPAAGSRSRHLIELCVSRT